MNTTMNREARLTLTYLITLTPEELGLENDVSDEEFMDTAYRYAEASQLRLEDWIPADIELELAKED